MPFRLVYKKRYCGLSTKSMHINVAESTIIKAKICFYFAQDAMVICFCRKVKLERVFEVGRIIDLKWRLDTFFVVPFITFHTKVIVCTNRLSSASTAIVLWISFFIVAPEKREYDMIYVIRQIGTMERGSLELEKEIRY